MMDFVREPRPTILAASVAIIAILIYANSLSNQFAYDDEWIITDRPVVHGVDRIAEVLTAEYWPDEFDSGLYRPITLVSFAVDWEIWDGNAFGFHLTNIVLHALVSALIVFLLMCFFPPWYAWAGGMVFAVHALHTEAVANVVGRGELLAAMFVIVAALVYTRAARDSRRFRPTVIALLAACYAAAGFSKEVGFVMPGLLLATDLPLLARGTDLRRYLRERLALFSVLTVVLVLLFIARSEVLGAALQSVPDRAFTVDDSFSTRLFTMTRVWPRYLALLVFILFFGIFYLWNLMLGLVLSVVAMLLNTFRKERLPYPFLLNIAFFSLAALTLLECLQWFYPTAMLPLLGVAGILLTLFYLGVGILGTQETLPGTGVEPARPFGH